MILWCFLYKIVFLFESKIVCTGIQKTSFTDQQLTSLSLPTPKLKFTIRKQNQQKHARQEQKNLILILRPQNRFGPLELVGLAWLDKSFFCYFWHVLYSKSLVIKILTYVFWTVFILLQHYKSTSLEQGARSKVQAKQCANYYLVFHTILM